MKYIPKIEIGLDYHLILGPLYFVNASTLGIFPRHKNLI
jgi:hypothetical protein